MTRDDNIDVAYWPLAAPAVGSFRGSFQGQSGHQESRPARQLMTHNVTLPRLTNNFLFKDRCALPDQMSFVLTFARRAFVLAMRNRDRTNLDEIAIFGLSVTPKDFPHNMLPGRRPKLKVASHPRSARRSCPGPARCFFWGAKNRYYTQLCCSARVRSWPLADIEVTRSDVRFRGQSRRAIRRQARR